MPALAPPQGAPRTLGSRGLEKIMRSPPDNWTRIESGYEAVPGQGEVKINAD